jgi:hypothetical protein
LNRRVGVQEEHRLRLSGVEAAVDLEANVMSLLISFVALPVLKPVLEAHRKDTNRSPLGFLTAGF